MVQYDLHLPVPVRPRTVRIQVNGDGAEYSCRMFDVGDQSAQMADALFLAPHFILAVRQRDGMDIFHRISGKHCQAVDRICILALDKFLDAASLLQGDINGSKCVIQSELICEIASDEPVAAAGHAIVEFGQEEDIAVFQLGMIFQSINNAIESSATFNVPGESADLVRTACSSERFNMAIEDRGLG